MGFLRYIAKSLVDFAGQIITGIGFFMFLGGIAAPMWSVAIAGAVLMAIGFFLVQRW